MFIIADIAYIEPWKEKCDVVIDNELDWVGIK